jgi:hypothetical protein
VEIYDLFPRTGERRLQSGWIAKTNRLRLVMNLAFLLIGAITIFFVGNLYRIVRIVRMPAHLRWDLYPIPKGPRERQSYGGSYFEESNWWTRPAEDGKRGELQFMLNEVLLLRGVWEGFRALWPWSFLLHWGAVRLHTCDRSGCDFKFISPNCLRCCGRRRPCRSHRSHRNPLITFQGQTLHYPRCDIQSRPAGSSSRDSHPLGRPRQPDDTHRESAPYTP